MTAEEAVESANNEVLDVFADKAERELIFAQLKIHGVAGVSVSFSGQGDSGQINDIACWSHKMVPSPYQPPGVMCCEALDADKIMLSLPSKVMVFSDEDRDSNVNATGWQVVDGVGQVSLKDAAERLFWLIDGEAQVDWSNNDGGRGEFEIDVDDGTITCHYEQYETVSSDAGTWEIV